jgi:acyl-CoA synthetase (NDP forming)
VHRDIDRACDVLAALVTRPAREPEPIPSAATPLADTSYDAARALLAEAGIGFMPARVVHHLDALRTALAEPEMSFPVVLKAVGSLHKSDAGGVVLGLPDAAAAEDAYLDLVARLAPPAVSVEVMADLDAGVELIVGCLRDPRFGPVLMVGLGGVFAEVLGDTAVALAPVSRDGARALLTSLRGAPLLDGARGRVPVDLEALADLVARVSAVAAAHPELAELEVNPVLATSDGALALDARAVPVGSAQDPTSRR